MIAWLAGIGGGVLACAAFIPYARATIYGEAKPNPISWWIWMWLGIIVASSYLVAGGGVETAAICIAYVAGPLVLAILATRKRMKESPALTIVEICALVGGVAGLIAWIITSDAKVGLIVCLLSEAAAAVPTVVQAWWTPRHECITAWGLMLAAAIVNLWAVKVWDDITALQPILLVSDSGLIFLVVVIARCCEQPPEPQESEG